MVASNRESGLLFLGKNVKRDWHVSVNDKRMTYLNPKKPAFLFRDGSWFSTQVTHLFIFGA